MALEKLDAAKLAIDKAEESNRRLETEVRQLHTKIQKLSARPVYDEADKGLWNDVIVSAQTVTDASTHLLNDVETAIGNTGDANESVTKWLGKLDPESWDRAAKAWREGRFDEYSGIMEKWRKHNFDDKSQNDE